MITLDKGVVDTQCSYIESSVASRHSHAFCSTVIAFNRGKQLWQLYLVFQAMHIRSHIYIMNIIKHSL